MTNNNELSHSPIGNEVGSSIESFGDEWRNWLVTGGIAVILILSIVLFRSHNASNEEKASRMLGEARNGQALQSILSQYPSTSAAKLALLQMAKAQYDNGDYVAAQSSYQDFLSKYPTHPMAAIAEMGKIHCTEGLGNTEVALAAFSQFATKNPDHFLMPSAIFGKARCLQDLKRYAEARATYEDFLAANPKSPWASDVNEALKQLDSEARKPSIKLCIKDN